MLQFHRSVALVRRTESSVQFGVDDPVLIDGLTDGDFALIDNITRALTYDDGVFVRWLLNTLLYVVAGAGGATGGAERAGDRGCFASLDVSSSAHACR